MVFASINFFSSRYLLGAHSLLLSSAAIILFSIPNTIYQTIMLILVPLFGLNNIDNSLTLNNFSDVDLSYQYLVQAELDMIQYLEEKNYVEKMLEPIQHKYLRSPVHSIKREDFGLHKQVRVEAQGTSHLFDHVILATHSDQSLAMLSDASEDEKNILKKGSIFLQIYVILSLYNYINEIFVTIFYIKLVF
jgi:hypothetical protein